MSVARSTASSYTLRSWLFPSDPRRLSGLYLATAAAFAAPALAAGLVLRLELATPAGDLLSAPAFDALTGFHGSAMLWLVLLPAIPSGLGYFAVTALGGATRSAFPKLAVLSWYLLVLAGLDCLRRLVYMDAYAQAAQSLALLSFTLTVFNIAVTLGRRRPLPPFFWALLLTAPAGLAAAASIALFGSSAQPLIVLSLVPAFGVIAEILEDRPPLWLLAVLAAAPLIPTGSRLLTWTAPPSIDVLVVVLPPLGALAPAALLVRWLASLCVQRRAWTAAVTLAGVSVGLGACGAAAGLLLALRATNVHLAATQFELAHSHFLAGCTGTALLAGCFHWWSSFAGRAAPELAGKLSAAVLLISWNAALLPQFFLGYLGMPAHAPGYAPALEWLNLISSLGVLAATAGMALAVGTLLWSAVAGASSLRPVTSNLDRQ